MKLPCEHALWYTLPQIRADLARALVKKSLSQKDVAAILGVTPAAISQYLHKKRGAKARMPADYKKRIAKAAGEISMTSSDKEIIDLICACCKQTQKIPPK